MADFNKKGEEEPEGSDQFIGKRVGAYIIDSLIVGLLTSLLLLFALKMDMGLSYLVSILIAWAVFGPIQWFYSSLMEGFAKCTIGQRMMGLEVALVEPPEEGDDTPIGGRAFIRNILKFIFPLGFITLAIRDFAGCYFRPYTEPEPVPERKAAWKPKEVPAEDLTLKTELPFPEELLNGQCTRCGTPYRLNPDGDSFSGLWNYRCTWCNTMVFEHLQNRRTMPGFM
jgi:hypothetical protein